MLGVKGKCVVDRRCVLLCEGDTLYTDANGREYLKRVRNVRPTWNLTVTQPESGNYYPLTAGAYIQVHTLWGRWFSGAGGGGCTPLGVAFGGVVWGVNLGRFAHP